MLELIFSVFGDQEVLDNYQKAKNEQIEIGRELDKLEDELSRLGLRLREAEANVNSFLEWDRTRKEINELSVETLPQAELADLHERISLTRLPLRKKRLELSQCRQNYADLRGRMENLLLLIENARTKEDEMERSVEKAEQIFQRRRDDKRDAEKILNEKKALDELCMQQRAGLDAPALATEHRESEVKLAANNFELKKVREQIFNLQQEIVALKTGQKIEPEAVIAFRRALEQANIPHSLFADIVEVANPHWQKATEGVLRPFAHIVLLKDKGHRRRAWELGEELRYRYFVVVDRSPSTEVTSGSMLEVVRFLEPPPVWVADLLNRIRRVASVQEGSRLPDNVSWITMEGYHRESRGARYTGVEAGKFQFGEAARKNRIAEAERNSAELQKREKELVEQNSVLSRRIDDIATLLAGIDAARQLTARSAEFSHVEREFPLVAQYAKQAGKILDNCKQELKSERESRHNLERGQSVLNAEIDREGETLRRVSMEFSNQRRQQVEKIIEYRGRRRMMPPSWYLGQAREQLRFKYGSAEAVRRDIERLEKKLSEGTWVTDGRVVEVKEKIQGDYFQLEETIKTRRVHHQRHIRVTDEARESYINVLRATVRRYSRNVRSLGQLAGIGVAVDPPHLVNEDLALAQAGLNVKFDFDRKGLIGLNDGEASGGQQVMKSLILLIGLLMDESRTGGFVFIDEPFAHLDVFNIDKVGAFLEATRAQYVLTTPNTHNVNVFNKSDLTLVTQKKRHSEKWAPPVAFLRRETRGNKK